MPQATVKDFDPRTGACSVVLDSQEELTVEPAVFARSGLLELRIGQRVRLEVEAGDQGQRVSRVDLVSF